MVVAAKDCGQRWQGLALTFLVSAMVTSCLRAPVSTAREGIGAPRAHLDHSGLIVGPFKSGPEVTKRCLECHASEGKDFMASTHFTWIDEHVKRPNGEPFEMGKKTAINNFCIGIAGNWPSCTSCHAGYGWKDKSFDFKAAENMDCLVCHDRSGQYAKGPAGNPKADVDLLASARSVGIPTRDNCGNCHFAGGGGDAVKHGDLDGSMYFPAARVDVHMGRENLQCVDCHRTKNHQIAGQVLRTRLAETTTLSCADCHRGKIHRLERLNGHTASVACQTCHIPTFARDAATKLTWDWSQAGKDGMDSPTYMKKKGRFSFGKDVVPEYFWYNGQARRYIPGDRVDPSQTVVMNEPMGSITDTSARIAPFKAHRGKQPYDVKNQWLLYVTTSGEGGFWREFDWAKALRLGSEASGLAFSGQYGFVSTVMYWPTTHMVASKQRSLQCVDCHGETGRLDWKRLGYAGDPAVFGGRARQGFLTEEVAR